MRFIRLLIPLCLGVVVLAALMASTPGYDDAFKPLRQTVQHGESAHGRLFSVRFVDWMTAERLAYQLYGKPTTKDTQGVFLLADFQVSDVRESVSLSAAWQGPSGRRYAQTARLEDAPSALKSRQFHPGIETKGRAIFELPPDEIAGGTLLVSRKGLNVLDTELALLPPNGHPKQHALEQSLNP
ncbi:hypothetical protein H0484_02970 [Pusillimonas sp. CC-YST705]|uniref:LPS export ABC transporter periplasmic protein LptC n=1 Tax=Mesopusillimonas faecipullorum TaxID=2755040 RepID=A0ABS8CA42_9BURK|nr:hypothetical protein [Mesopusillimonas faecipullorum]MCB5362717.1 hypothetical protein [Mesopusillimonas faecipullorum]